MSPHFGRKHLIGALGLSNAVSASVLPATSSVNVDKRDGEPWPYGVTGDSWGSGVAWSKEVLYDDNKGTCLRTKESHGPQMEGDNAWTGFGKTTLHDAACSGRTLGDIVAGEHQIGQIGNPNVMVMTAGGNQAGFGHIVEVCIYHPDPKHNYGPAYKDDKDGKGECAVALDDALKYITRPPEDGAPGMEYDLRVTLDDVFKDSAVKDNSDFLLYITGYAQFFGTDYDEWCNNQYWNVPSFNPLAPTPYLSKELRQTINDHVSKVNSLYQKVASSYSKQTRYVDLDKRFAGHRFCEPGATYQDQINTDTHFDKVWLWNLNWPWQVNGQGAPSAQAAEGKVSAQEAQNVFQGQGVTAWTGTGSQGGNDPSNGWRLRPFHPRFTGYTSIKDAIIEQMKADGLPKVAATPSTTQPAGPACSHVQDGFHCQCNGGDVFDIDEDNRCCRTNPDTGDYECFNADGD